MNDAHGDLVPLKRVLRWIGRAPPPVTPFAKPPYSPFFGRNCDQDRECECEDQPDG